jgi:hypothetical protein
MMNVLHTIIKGANCVVFLINGQNERFGANMQNMIRQLQALFGEAFWLNTIIGVSHWSYDQNSINERNFTGKTEEKFIGEMNELLQSKFHFEGELEGVFIDAWSQNPWNLGDQVQQDVFKRETSKLKTFIENHEIFPFRTIEDVLNENQKFKEENERLNDIIEKNITELNNLITALTTEVISLTTTHQHDIDELSAEFGSLRVDHTMDINKVREDVTNQISVEVTSLTDMHTNDIDRVRATLNDEIDTVRDTVNTLDGEIATVRATVNTLDDEIDSLNLAPIGTITAWTHRPNSHSNKAVDLPSGWALCDGEPITEGIWKGQKTPDINGNEYFLRGSSQDHVLATQGDSVKELTYRDFMFHTWHCPSGWTDEGDSDSGTCGDCDADHYCSKKKTVEGTEDGKETRPKNMKVVYIMKIN